MSLWFEEIFGFREGTGQDGYKQTQERFAYNPETGKLTAQSLEAYEFKAGFFKTPSLEELRTNNDLEKAGEDLGGQQLEVVEEIGDVSEFHVLEGNRFATFQAASQFNTLEHTSQFGLPEHGITCYAGDHTQGPACAVTCAPGTVVRNYFAFGTKGQTKDRQVRNLEDVEELLNNAEEEYFKVQSGYTMTGRSISKLGRKLKDDADLCERIQQKLRIGVQEDTEVVCSNFGSELYEGERQKQLVTQAYCSAISISYAGAGSALWERFAVLILESLYEATLYVALENAMRHPEELGARKVFLTAVGGGVFGNDMAWIVAAMQKAFDKFKNVGLKVYLVSYGRPTREFAQLLS